MGTSKVKQPSGNGNGRQAHAERQVVDATWDDWMICQRSAKYMNGILYCISFHLCEPVGACLIFG
jgi:hypothetical protein